MMGLKLLTFLAALSPLQEPTPSGTIAFMREGKVWLVDVDGKNERALTPELMYKADRPLTWSPDGKTLLYWSHSKVGWDIWATDPQGKQPRNLTKTTSGGCRSARFSPDGKRIAFMRDDPQGVYVMDADGSNQRQLSKKGHRDAAPEWSPDGKRLVCVDYEELGRGEFAVVLFMLDVETGAETRLAEGANDPSWSRDGKRIICVAPGRTLDICQIDVTTKEIVNLTNNRDVDSEPRVSSDGSLIAFLSHHGDQGMLRVMDDQGKNVRLLASLKGRTWEYSWSPDSKWLVYSCGEKGKEELFIVSVQGGNPRKLAGGGAVWPAWQPKR